MFFCLHEALFLSQPNNNIYFLSYFFKPFYNVVISFCERSVNFTEIVPKIFNFKDLHDHCTSCLSKKIKYIQD